MGNDIQNQQEEKCFKDSIADLKNSEAAIIECPKCKKETFIGIAQAYTSDDKPYPVGNCCVCDMNLKALNDETDVELMMEFRNMYWDKWVLFCMTQNSEPVMRGD